MFARAQSIDAEINAFARMLPLADIANLDRVSLSAGGLDAEVGEDRMARLAVRDAKVLGLRSGAAAVDFVLVGRAPIVKRRHFHLAGCLFCHGSIIRQPPAESKLSCSKLFTVCSPSRL